MKKNEGITLIALVVTIIVLIILAGVSMNLILGDNGIITKAKWAKKTYGEEAIREKVSLILGEYVTEENETNKSLQEYLEEQSTKGTIESTEDNQDGTQSVIVDDYIVTIDKDTLEIIDVSKLGPRPIISNIKVTVENEVDGTEIEAKENEVEPGTPLKIIFDVTFEEGTIIGINKGELNTGKVQYTTDGKEIEVIFIVTGKIEGECRKVQKVSLKKFYKKSEVTAEDIAKNPIGYYGELVTNYTCPSEGVQSWRIFYADETNIYLISDDYIPRNYIPKSPNGFQIKEIASNAQFDNIVNDETYSIGSSWIIENSKAKKWLKLYLTINTDNQNRNIKSTAYMLDTNVWTTYYAGEKAEYAIGGPTMELLCASYKDTHPDKYIECEQVNSIGYYVKYSTSTTYGKSVTSVSKDFNNIYVKEESNTGNANTMFIASPWLDVPLLYDLNYNGNLGYSNFGYAYGGFRPVVCLKSDIKLEKTTEGYMIKSTT